MTPQQCPLPPQVGVRERQQNKQRDRPAPKGECDGADVRVQCPGQHEVAGPEQRGQGGQQPDRCEGIHRPANPVQDQAVVARARRSIRLAPAAHDGHDVVRCKVHRIAEGVQNDGRADLPELCALRVVAGDDGDLAGKTTLGQGVEQHAV